MKFSCPICNETLLEKSVTAVCTFCGRREKTEYICPAGHYQCEECRLAGPEEIIERVCLNTSETNPVSIANLIMKHISFQDFGTEHHLLVGPCLLTALRNLGFEKVTDTKIRASIKKGSIIPLGACGSTGICGAAVSAGGAVALLTNSHYRKGRERSFCLQTVSRSLDILTELQGPRCCKYSVYASIESAWNSMQTILGEKLPPLSITCEFQGQIPDCRKENCRFTHYTDVLS